MSPIKIEQSTGSNAGTADKDYFLDGDGNVTEDQEKAATLLIRAGQDVPKEMADKYGIGKVAQEAGPDAAASEKETNSKTVSEKAAAPARNKAKAPAKNK